MSRPPRSLFVVGLALGLLGSACSVSVDNGQVSFVDEDAQLFCDATGSLALAAQAVPTAPFIPCITEMPAGWSVDRSDFAHDGVEVKIDSRRAPIDDMIFTFTAACTPGADVPAPESLAFETPIGSITTQDIDGLSVRLVVSGDGYCAQYALDLEAAEQIDADDFPTFAWISRAAIDDGVANLTDDRLRLDR